MTAVSTWAGRVGPMSGRFDGRVVLITGGAGAIAAATGRAFVEQGAVVVLAGRDESKLVEAAKRMGDTVDWTAADVTDSGAMADLVASVAARHGGLHVA